MDCCLSYIRIQAGQPPNSAHGDFGEHVFADIQSGTVAALHGPWLFPLERSQDLWRSGQLPIYSNSAVFFRARFFGGAAPPDAGASWEFGACALAFALPRPLILPLALGAGAAPASSTSGSADPFPRLVRFLGEAGSAPKSPAIRSSSSFHLLLSVPDSEFPSFGSSSDL